jgi:hypothetical protein
MCRPENGRLNLQNREAFLRYVQTLSGLHDIIIRKHKKDRSIQQNRYYWGVCLKIISDEIGHSVEELHQMMKLRFLLEKEVEIAGEKYGIAKSTTKLTTAEFETYLENIKRFAAAELGIYIPDPHEVNYQ